MQVASYRLVTGQDLKVKRSVMSETGPRSERYRQHIPPVADRRSRVGGSSTAFMA
jgi:hypothetical protein